MATSNNPEWLQAAAWIYQAIAAVCALGILVDINRRPLRMAIMNVVWPITALYFGPFALWEYVRTARAPASSAKHREKSDGAKREPTHHQVALAATHCGTGCTIGDIVGELLIAGAGLSLLGGGFGMRLAIDFVLAWVFGIGIQYFTIAPMRHLPFHRAIAAAIKADTISIIFFQIGMTIWMALTYFVFFPSPHLQLSQPLFWFMMQIAMILGFFTSYPANRWLLRKGWKEAMPESSEAGEAVDEAA